jgi:two-component system cell cycle sensor histidine kinase/response regulator CckA
MADATFLSERRRQQLDAGSTLPPGAERLYRAIGDVAPGFLWLVDAAGRFVYVNRTWEEFTGSTLEQLNRHGWEQFNHPDDLPEVSARWAQAGERREQFEMELRYRRHDGEYRWMLARVVPIEDSGGSLEGWVGTSVDIHQLREAQDALRRSELELSDFFENASIPIHWVGADGTILRVNQAELDLLGYRREEYVGRNISEFHVDQVAIEDILQRLTAGEVLHDYPARLQCKDGSIKDVLIDSSVYFHEGEFVHTRCFTRDVTAQRAAEQATQRLVAIVASSADAIVGKTLDGVVTSWNKAAERIFGYSAEEMVGSSIFRLVPEELHETERFLLEQIRKGERVEFSETDRLCKDGSRISIALSVSPIRDGLGRVVGASSIKRDITERKRAERALAESQERLRQAQRIDSVGQLAGGIAHEANNMMSVVLGCADYVLQRTDLPEAVRQDVDQIWRAAQRTARITQQLLAFSRRQMLQPQILDLNTIVRALEPILARALGESRGLRLHLSPTLGRIRADPGQLEQVLINLTLNARDAMDEGGRLTIETMNVVLDAAYVGAKPVGTLEPGEYAALVVTDTGHGMDRETLSRIFEPFFTTKGVGQGTGLGLSTAYGIVKQSGGFIWAYSEPGLGATFKLYFPLVESAPELAKVQEPAPGGRTEEVVLIAEDEPMVRSIMARSLRDCGYTVLEAADGREALHLVESRNGRLSLIVADVVMPDMGGRNLATRVAERWPDVPVLFTSGYTGMDVIRRGLLEEGREFLQKPLAPEELARKVREMMDARAPAPGR